MDKPQWRGKGNHVKKTTDSPIKPEVGMAEWSDSRNPTFEGHTQQLQ